MIDKDDIRDDTHDVYGNCSIFWPPCPSTSKIFPRPWPWTSNFKRTPSFHLITNQLKENVIKGWLLDVIRSFFQGSFLFQYQLINLAWIFFGFDFIHLLKPHYLLFRGFILLCVQLSKNITKCFFYYHSSFWYSFCNHPALFAQLENVNRLLNNNRTVHVNELKTKTKPNHVTFQLTTGSIGIVDTAMVSLKDGFTVWRQS